MFANNLTIYQFFEMHSAAFMFKIMRKYMTIGLLDLYSETMDYAFIQYLFEVQAPKTRLYHMGDRSDSFMMGLALLPVL